MVMHTMVSLMSAGKMMYGYMANMLETSMLSIFINVSYADIGLCEENLDNAEAALGLMQPLLLTQGIDMIFMYHAWDEYIEMQKTILTSERTLFGLLKGKFGTCKEYWEEWHP